MSLPKAYYEHGGITIYHGDCREILPCFPVYDFGTLVLTDPPYGIGADKNKRGGKRHGNAAVASKDYGVGNWDDSPPSELTLAQVIQAGEFAIIFGGNYFELPASPKWLVWDKENGENGYADCELAWTNLRGAVRMFRFRWMGMLQGNMKEKEERYHPTQKPTELMRWCIGQVGGVQKVIDPFMGSGTTLVAAKNLQRKAIGIEIEEKYCEIAAKRLSQEILPFDAPIQETKPLQQDLI